MSLETDENICACRSSGYKEILEKLIAEYQRPLYFLCLRIVDNHEDAADLVQHTFLQAVKKVNDFHGYASLKTWLYAIAINLCRNFLRRRAMSLKTLSSLLICKDDKQERDPLEEDEIRDIVRESLNTLPEKQRMAVILRIYEDMSYREIGEVMGCRDGTARSHVHRGLKSLALKLQQLQE